MRIFKLFEENFFFIAVAFLLAFGFYQNVGDVAGTETPVVSVVSNSMKHDYPSGSRIGHVLSRDLGISDYFSPEIGFERGDIILVKGTSINDIETGEKGDVIVYESKEEVIRNSMPPMIHRAVSKSGGTVDTKGDANSGTVKYCINRYGSFHMTSKRCGSGEELVRIEENISEEQVLGEAFLVIPKLGYAKILPTCLFSVLRGKPGRAKLMCGGIF